MKNSSSSCRRVFRAETQDMQCYIHQCTFQPSSASLSERLVQPANILLCMCLRVNVHLGSDPLLSIRMFGRILHRIKMLSEVCSENKLTKQKPNVTHYHERYTKSLAANGTTRLNKFVTQFCRFRVNQLFSHFGHSFTSAELLGADFHKKNGWNRVFFFFAWQWTWMRPTLHKNTPYSSAAADEAIAIRAMCDASMETSSSRGFSPCLWMNVLCSWVA